MYLLVLIKDLKGFLLIYFIMMLAPLFCSIRYNDNRYFLYFFCGVILLIF